MYRHILPVVDHDVHAVHSDRCDRHSDRAGLSGLRPAAEALVTSPPGKINSSAVAGHERVRRAGNHAQLAGVHR